MRYLRINYKYFRFKAPQGMLIKVSWRNFHLDNCNKGNFLRIFDGFDPESTPFYKTYCGLKKPDLYVTSGIVYDLC